MYTQNKVLKFLLGVAVIYITCVTTAFVCYHMFSPDNTAYAVESDDAAPIPVEPQEVISEDHIVIVHHREFIDRANLDEPYVALTDEEKRLLAIVVKLEGGNQSIACQYAIASVIINRYTSSNLSIRQIIYAPDQFSVTPSIPNTEPSETQIRIVENVCKYGITIPEYVTYFRANEYHKDTGLPYFHLDDTYFSYNQNLFDKYIEKVVNDRECKVE